MPAIEEKLIGESNDALLLYTIPPEEAYGDKEMRGEGFAKIVPPNSVIDGFI